MRFYAASYGPRYGDPICTFVSLKPGLAEEAAEAGAEFERDELPGYCEDSCKDCSFCCPDVVVYGEAGYYRTKDLFTAAELKEHRHALRNGEVVPLYR